MSKQPTFVTLTKLQNREPTLLQTAIDNTRGKLNVALKSFHYEVGYQNLGAGTLFLLNLLRRSQAWLQSTPPNIKVFCIAIWRAVYL